VVSSGRIRPPFSTLIFSILMAASVLAQTQKKPVVAKESAEHRYARIRYQQRAKEILTKIGYENAMRHCMTLKSDEFVDCARQADKTYGPREGTSDEDIDILESRLKFADPCKRVYDTTIDMFGGIHRLRCVPCFRVLAKIELHKILFAEFGLAPLH
jgi:hypothetical protein